jgi:uncharacterized protein (TIGR00251 family)
MNNSHDNHQRIAKAAKRADNGLVVFLHVVPGASRAAIVGLIEDRLKVSVTKKAMDGAANEAVRALLADCFDLNKSSVTLLKGEKSKQKSVLLKGDSDALVAKLTALIAKTQTGTD